MPLTTPCPNCKIVLTYGEQYAGKQMRCPQCKTVVTTPAALSGPTPPAPVPKPVPKVVPSPAGPVAVKPPSALPPVARPTAEVPTFDMSDDEPYERQPRSATRQADTNSPFRPGYLGWGNVGLAVGAAIVLALIVLTTLAQMVGIAGAESSLRAIDWLEFSTGEWSLSSVTFANYFRYFANFLLIVLLLPLSLSLWSSAMAVSSKKLKLLPLAAGLCWVPAVVLAVAIPTAVSVVYGVFNPDSEGMYEEHVWLVGSVFVLCFGGAYALALTGACCYLLFLRGVARAAGQPKLGAGVLWLLAALVVGSVVVLLPGLLASTVSGVLAKDPENQSFLASCVLFALFGLWVLFAAVGYVWLLILQRQVSQAVRTAPPPRIVGP